MFTRNGCWRDGILLLEVFDRRVDSYHDIRLIGQISLAFSDIKIVERKDGGEFDDFKYDKFEHTIGIKKRSISWAFKYVPSLHSLRYLKKPVGSVFGK